MTQMGEQGIINTLFFGLNATACLRSWASLRSKHTRQTNSGHLSLRIPTPSFDIQPYHTVDVHLAVFRSWIENLFGIIAVLSIRKDSGVSELPIRQLWLAKGEQDLSQTETWSAVLFYQNKIWEGDLESHVVGIMSRTLEGERDGVVSLFNFRGRKP